MSVCDCVYFRGEWLLLLVVVYACESVYVYVSVRVCSDVVVCRVYWLWCVYVSFVVQLCSLEFVS